MSGTSILEVVVFVTVACLVFGIGSLFDAGGRLVPLSIRKGSRFDDVMNTRIANSFVPDNESRRTRLRLQLLQAGFESPRALYTLYGFRVALAVLFPIVAFVLLSPFPLERRVMVPICTVASLVGFLLPVWVVASRRRSRQREARDGFPDMLDLLLVCSEAGLGIDTAIMKVAEEIDGPYPVLAEHLHQVTRELRAGRTRTDAMRTLADRTGIDAAISLVNLLIQSDELGTSIADTLRAFSEELRAKRILRAEELAHTVGVKLSIIAVSCFLPAIMVAIMTPVVYNVYTTLHTVFGH